MRKTMLYVTLLFWSTEYECDVGYNFAKNLIRDNKAILKNVHSTQYKKLLYAKVKKRCFMTFEMVL